MDFSAFDFRDDFTLHEIASLCIGRDPASPIPVDADPATTAYREILSAATASTTMANSECASVHIANLTRADLHPNLLYPSWALERIPWNTGESAWTEISRDQWPEVGFDVNVQRWRFDRRTIASWLSGRPFKPVYDFSRQGGLLVTAEDEKLTTLHPNAETTYLNIIGALLELVRNPRPGRDSDAAVIRELINNYSDKPGISKTTLEVKFASARRRLNSS